VAREAALGAQLGLDPAAPVIGYIGSFYDYEGVDDLIKAMPLLRARHPAARLLLVGAGAMEAAWRRAAAALPEPDAVIFTGRVPHEAVERYYSLVDVLAYPRKASRLTDLVTPLKPLEAMAQQRLVAASDVGGHRELITHGETGWLFAADDPAACAGTLADVLDAAEAWPAMKSRALNHVRTRHDWACNVRNYLPVYQTLLDMRMADGRAQRVPVQANG
jgi:glycosyltransferase involved in cell wall biosynthesis